MPQNANGKRVLITGASSGIGAAVALYLAERGFQVWGTTRNLSKVKSLPQELQERVRFIAMDVNDDESVAQGVKEYFAQAKGIDILINNAGFGVLGPIEEFPLERTKQIFETNYFGTLRVTQAVLPTMREQRQGLIINMASLGGKFIIPFQTHYSATKAAVEALTEGLRQEVRPFGVKVVAILPGDIKTNFNDVIDFGDSEKSPYKPWVDASWHMTDVNMQKAPAAEVIARKVYQVIRKKNPRTRYAAGDFLSTKFPFISRLVTDRVKEKLIRIFYGIDFK